MRNKTDRHDITEILLKVKRYNAIHSPFDFVDVISGMYVSRKHLLLIRTHNFSGDRH
jgi:hypothetical protein